MNRNKVEAWLRAHGSELLTFSEVSRALITNDHKQRARSPAARDELRTLLTVLETEGLLRLSPTTNSVGQRGLQIEVLDQTHEEGNT